MRFYSILPPMGHKSGQASLSPFHQDFLWDSNQSQFQGYSLTWSPIIVANKISVPQEHFWMEGFIPGCLLALISSCPRFFSLWMSPTWFPETSESRQEQNENLVLHPNHESNIPSSSLNPLGKKASHSLLILACRRLMRAMPEAEITECHLDHCLPCPPVYLYAVGAEILQNQRPFMSYHFSLFKFSWCFLLKSQ